MRKLQGLCIMLALTFTAAAQPVAMNNGSANPAEDSTIARYLSNRGELLPIYNGRQFSSGYAAIKGSAFYAVKDWTMGSVCYEGVWYHQLPLLYDIYRDELLLRHPSGIPLVLYGDRVQAFEFNDLKFVRLSAEQTGMPRTGYYEVLEQGPLTIYAYRFRLLEERIVDQHVEKEFMDKSRYYAVWKNEVISVSSQKQLSGITRDKRQEIQQALKAAGVRFKKNPAEALKIIAHTFNQSNH
ncbi:MAG: hypothetical protein QM781_09765 [Chitinophagaceae bacterium]